MPEAPPVRDRAVADLIRAALAEDLGEGDITSAATVPADRTCIARIKAKAPGVLAGALVAEAVFLAVDPSVDYQADCVDGSHLSPGDHIAVIGGRARSLLAAERVALNFLQHLSGIATATAEAVRLVSGTETRILDTRKTTPGVRALEKYAVTLGGGLNHRQGLFDRLLIKENHVALAGGIEKAVAAARSGRPGDPVEIEVRNTSELEQALAAGAERVLLDNFSPAQAADAVALVGSRAEVEISGGVRPGNLRAFAAAHADFISVGWLTHSAPALDMSMTLVV